MTGYIFGSGALEWSIESVKLERCKRDTYSLKVVLHLSQLCHDSHGLSLARHLVNFGILVRVSLTQKTNLHLDIHTSTLINTLCSYSSLLANHSTLEKTVSQTFSSPMVNFPVVTLLFSANEWSFCTASRCDTEAANLTLDFVYSCPGCHQCQKSAPNSIICLPPHIDHGVVWQSSQTLVQSLVHLRRGAFKESSAT